MTIQKQMDESATGCYSQRVLLIYHKSDPDSPISLQKARKLLFEGEEVEITGAGSGAYADLDRLLELDGIEPWETGSSAGDWTFRLPLQLGKFIAQRNRYPFHGFGYTMFEDMAEWGKGIK